MEFCKLSDLYKAFEKYQKKNGKPYRQEIIRHIIRQNIDAFKYIN